jgi:hypothetical protein
MRVEDADGDYELSFTRPLPGATAGSLTFSGAAGDATLSVSVQGVEAPPLQEEVSVSTSPATTPPAEVTTRPEVTTWLEATPSVDATPTARTTPPGRCCALHRTFARQSRVAVGSGIS